MENNTKAPAWKVVIALMDEEGNVKLTQEVAAPKETKDISFAVKGDGYPKNGGESKKVTVLEWKVDELVKAMKSDGTEAKLNGKPAGFQVKATLRFSDYEVQLAHKNRDKGSRPVAARAQADM